MGNKNSKKQNKDDDEYLDIQINANSDITEYTLHLNDKKTTDILFKPVEYINCSDCNQHKSIEEFTREAEIMYIELNDKSLWIATSSQYSCTQEWHNQQYQKAINKFTHIRCCECISDFYNKIQNKAIDIDMCPGELDKEYHGGCETTCPMYLYF